MLVRLLVAPLIVLLLVAACGGDGETTPPAIGAEEALRRAAAAVEALQSFRFHLTHENGGSPIALGLEMTEAEGEISAPERMRASVKAQAAGLAVSVDAVAIGDRTWITNPFDRTWQELSGGLTGNRLFDPSTGVTAAIRAVTGAAITDGGRLQDTPTYLITGKVDAGRLSAFAPIAEQGRVVDVRIWVRQDDFLPLRLRIEGGLSAEEEEGLVRQLDLSDFDRPLDITPPPGG